VKVDCRVPPGLGEALGAPGVRVDVHGDGATSGTVTVRVLAGSTSLSWQLPVAPFVAALPGQPGDGVPAPVPAPVEHLGRHPEHLERPEHREQPEQPERLEEPQRSEQPDRPERRTRARRRAGDGPVGDRA